jgi:hypothetical protein
MYNDLKYFKMTDGKLVYYRMSPRSLTRGVLLISVLVFLLLPNITKDIPIAELIGYHWQHFTAHPASLILPLLIIAFVLHLLRSYFRENLMATNPIVIDGEKGILEFGEYVNSRQASRRSIRRRSVELEGIESLRIGDTCPDETNAHQEPVTVYIVQKEGSEIPLTGFGSDSLAGSFTREISDLIGI